MGDDGTTPCADASTSVVGSQGDVITYCWIVSNDGDTYLSNISVKDDALDFADSTPRILAPGDSFVVTMTSTIDDDLSNQAVVTANPSDKFGQDIPLLADVTTTSSDDSLVSVTLATPSPTVAPSSAPSAGPTKAPTKAPTEGSNRGSNRKSNKSSNESSSCCRCPQWRQRSFHELG